MIAIIAKSNMNNSFTEFNQLTVQVFGDIVDQINNGSFSYALQQLDLLKTIKTVFLQKCQRSSFKNPNLFKETCVGIIENIGHLWEYILNDLKSGK